MQCSKQGASLDCLVGDSEHARWDGKAERLGGLQIDDQGKFGGLLNRQVTWLCSLENWSDVLGRRLTVAPHGRVLVTNQAAPPCLIQKRIHGWNLMTLS